MSSTSTTTLIRFLILALVLLGAASRLPAQQANAHTLVYGVYQGEHTAGDVLAYLRKKQHVAGERLESYTVVSRSLDGKLTVRERPISPGSAIHTLLGALGEPSRESAASGFINPEVVDSLQASLTPGSSAVIALLDDRWVQQFQRDLKAARARAVVASVISQEMEDTTQ